MHKKIWRWPCWGLQRCFYFICYVQYEKQELIPLSCTNVELSWLKALAAEPKITEIPAFSDFTLAEIDKVIENFSLEDAAAVKAIEATTNHDVKAIEYWLKERFAGVPEVAATSEFIHFLLRSEERRVGKECRSRWSPYH